MLPAYCIPVRLVAMILLILQIDHYIIQTNVRYTQLKVLFLLARHLLAIAYFTDSCL